MTGLLHSTVVVPLLLGMDWMDPNWLLERFGTQFFWISLVIIFVECGLFFPFLPGDTLLFALGLFIAGEQVDLFPGGPAAELGIAIVLLTAPPSSATSRATRSAAPSGRRSTSATGAS